MSPGLSWDALLKKTGAELKLFTDYEMHVFVEREIRGGFLMVSIMYLDTNNLYGSAMSNPLPTRGFKWPKKRRS